MMLNEERVRRAMAEAFPNLDVGSVNYFAAGWDYEMWGVGDDLLVRFPLREECGAPLLVEARLLSALAGRLSLRIPEPVRVAEGCPSFAMPFFAYRKLPGIPLEQAKLDDEGRISAAARIGRFLSELHAFPIELAATLGVRVHDGPSWRARYRRMAARVDQEVLTRLSPAAARAVTAFWRTFLDDDRYFSFQPRLIHGDLDAAHVLVDPAGGAITGVIDFGDARVGDPAFDFSGYPEFKETFDVPLRDAILAAYELPLDKTFRERAAIYGDRISPFHAVFFGLETGDEGWLHRGLQAIESWAGDKMHK